MALVLKVGDTVTLGVYGDALSNYEVSTSSSCVSVSSDGEVSAVTEGTVSITVRRISDGYSRKLNIQVLPLVVEAFIPVVDNQDYGTVEMTSILAAPSDPNGYGLGGYGQGRYGF